LGRKKKFGTREEKELPVVLNGIIGIRRREETVVLCLLFVSLCICVCTYISTAVITSTTFGVERVDRPRRRYTFFLLVA